MFCKDILQHRTLDIQEQTARFVQSDIGSTMSAKVFEEAQRPWKATVFLMLFHFVTKNNVAEQSPLSKGVGGHEFTTILNIGYFCHTP